MFKKHPGKKATESTESQPNSVLTAGKTDDSEGDFAHVFLFHCFQCGKQTDDVVVTRLFRKSDEILFFICFVNLLQSYIAGTV